MPPPRVGSTGRAALSSPRSRCRSQLRYLAAAASPPRPGEQRQPRAAAAGRGEASRGCHRPQPLTGGFSPNPPRPLRGSPRRGSPSRGHPPGTAPPTAHSPPPRAAPRRLTLLQVLLVVPGLILADLELLHQAAGQHRAPFSLPPAGLGPAAPSPLSGRLRPWPGAADPSPSLSPFRPGRAEPPPPAATWQAPAARPPSPRDSNAAPSAPRRGANGEPPARRMERSPSQSPRRSAAGSQWQRREGWPGLIRPRPSRRWRRRGRRWVGSGRVGSGRAGRGAEGSAAGAGPCGGSPRLRWGWTRGEAAALGERPLARQPPRGAEGAAREAGRGADPRLPSAAVPAWRLRVGHGAGPGVAPAASCLVRDGSRDWGC